MANSIKSKLLISDEKLAQIKNQNSFEVSAPSNIALIKYWGKRGKQLPKNPSLSFTLNNAKTFIKVSFKEGKGSNEFYFEGQKNQKFEEKVFKLIDELILANSDFKFIKQFDLRFDSRNTFPHSAGIASSASSMAALSVALHTLKLVITGLDTDLSQVSSLARIGSGSAGRSIFPTTVLWGETKTVSGSSNEFALEIGQNFHEDYKTYGDAILLVSKEEKEVSSRVGHELMNDHPYAEVRYQNVETKIAKILEIMTKAPAEEFCELIESEALELHALMMMSNPSFILMKEKTLTIIQKIKNKRKASGIPLCFTLDAGPNIHLLYPRKHKDEVTKFIETELKNDLVNGEWIDDEVGTGPELVG